MKSYPRSTHQLTGFKGWSHSTDALYIHYMCKILKMTSDYRRCLLYIMLCNQPCTFFEHADELRKKSTDKVKSDSIGHFLNWRSLCTYTLKLSCGIIEFFLMTQLSLVFYLLGKHRMPSVL
ncbi:hypothetical protein DITRI_Ditri03aG0160700 [Diplodiscus trichospermus]